MDKILPEEKKIIKKELRNFFYQEECKGLNIFNFFLWKNGIIDIFFKKIT